jgi:hypothetical protein
MSIEQLKYEIRASFDSQTITVYQAYNQAIALPAIKHQKLVSPFSYDRMTWIKPSFFWMMYRSDWASSVNQEYILAIKIYRKNWENALMQAVLTTPKNDLYADKQEWEKLIKQAPVRVQWDPERNLQNQKLEYRSIQVGIGKKLSEEYATKWIAEIKDMTPLVKQIRELYWSKNIEKAESLAPTEEIYPTPLEIQKKLGMIL